MPGNPNDPYGWNVGYGQSIQSPAGPYAGAPTNTQNGAALAYGGYNGGAADWSKYYQGLGGAVWQGMSQAGANRQGADIAQGNALYGDAANYGDAAGGNIRNTANQYAGMQRQAGLGLAGLYQNPAGNAFAQQSAAAGYANAGLGDLQRAASGQGPSAAQAQLGQGIGAAVRAQLAAGASARGGAMQLAGAQQQAGINAAGIEAGAAGQAAQLRAQEVQHAQDSLVSAANQMYGSAGGMGLSALGGQTNAALTGLGGAANTAVGGAEAAANAGLTGIATGQKGLAAMQGLGAQEGLGYTTAGLQAQQNYESMGADVARNQLQSNIQQYGVDLGYQGQMQQLQAAQTNAIIGGVGSAAAAALPYAVAASDENLKTSVDPQGESSPGTAQGLPEATVADKDLMSTGRTRADLTGILVGLRRGFQQYGQMAGAPQAQPLTAAPQPLTATPLRPLNPQPWPPAGIVSDERAKAQISPAPTADALLATLAKSKSTYAYKNPADQPVSPAHPHVPGARFAGVMAQDLQKVPEIGAGLVTDTPRGKMLEQQAGLSAALMGLGRVAERLQAIERAIGVKSKPGGLSAALMGAR